jgi:hypothetical protein
MTQKLYPKIIRHHKQLHQRGRIQNQLTKIITFSYTTNNQTEKEYMEKMPFTVASNTIKYLGVNLTEDLNNLYMENYKP